MSVGAGPSKKPKTYHFHPEWEEDFFNNVIFEVHLSDWSIYHRYSKYRKCGGGTFEQLIETTILTSRQKAS